MRLCRAYYRDRDGGKRQSKRWYVELTDHRDTSRRIPAFEDKRASEEFGRKLERLVSLHVSGECPDVAMTRWLEGLPTTIRGRLAKIGLIDGQRIASTKPLAEHIDDFEQSLRDSGATVEYVKKTVNRVRAVADAIGAKFLTELTGEAVSGYLAARRAGKNENLRELSAKSSNHYLAAVKGFCNWLVRERRAIENPIAHISGQNAKADRRHVRRALEPDEVRSLLEAARNGPVRFGMTGGDRYWLYRLAVETGLRSGELRSLTRGSFDFASDAPTVTIEAASAKNGQTATLPLRTDTASELVGPFATMLPMTTVFKMPRPENVVQMLRGDLKVAKIPYTDDTGRVADFHSLRNTFASLLLHSGVDVRTAKDLMRHSTIAMTADVYACTFRGTMNEAVHRLPSFAPSQSELAKATGTDSVLPDCLPEQRPFTGNAVRGGASNPGDESSAQVVNKTGTYDAGECIDAHDSDCHDGVTKPPPRGFEPLLLA